jgi:DNA processing protein
VLVNEFDGAEAAIAALPTLSRRGGRAHDIKLFGEIEAEAELGRAESLGANLVALGEPGYPQALAHVDAPPPLLYIKGRTDLSTIPTIAIVGARNGSAIGQKFTRQLASELGLEGLSSLRGSRAVSIPRRIAPHLSMARSPC